MPRTNISKNGKSHELEVALSMLREPWKWEHGMGENEWNAAPSVITAHAAVSIAQSLKEIAIDLHAIRGKLEEVPGNESE